MLLPPNVLQGYARDVKRDIRMKMISVKNRFVSAVEKSRECFRAVLKNTSTSTLLLNASEGLPARFGVITAFTQTGRYWQMA